MVINAEYDHLRASGEAFTAALAIAGVDVQQHLVRGLLHGFLNQPAGLGPVGACLELIAGCVSTARTTGPAAAGAAALSPQPEEGA